MQDDRLALRLTLTVLFFSITPTLAQAYIDPGNGAYMVQAAFAFVGAAIFYMRHPIRSLQTFWHWIASHWQPSDNEMPHASPAESNGQEGVRATDKR